PDQSQKIYRQFERATKNLKEDTNKVLIYLKFARSLQEYPQYRDSTAVIEENAKKLAYKLNYQRGVELSIYEEGFHAEINKDFPKAIRYYREAIKIGEAHKSYTGIYGRYFEIYEVYNSALNLYYYNADYPNAMDIA